MSDPTEDFRKQRVYEINSNPKSREQLKEEFGQVWDTQEVQRDFEVQGFMAPYIVVVRKSDGVKGSMEFQASPRFYYNFQEA